MIVDKEQKGLSEGRLASYPVRRATTPMVQVSIPNLLSRMLKIAKNARKVREKNAIGRQILERYCPAVLPSSSPYSLIRKGGFVVKG